MATHAYENRKIHPQKNAKLQKVLLSII